MDVQDAEFSRWMEALEARQLADLTFPQVSRALRALSSTYVERRGRLGEGAALSGAGKRAAFALFYGPLHFLLLRHVVTSLPARLTSRDTLVDLGCGTGAAGAAWASAFSKPAEVQGIDRHPWAADEAKRTYRTFGLRARVRVEDITRARLSRRSHVLAAFTVNELNEPGRDAVLAAFLEHAERRGRVLVVEPLAGFVAPWWRRWRDRFESAGGRADEWRIRVPLPPLVEKLDRAAGLDHRELTARTLFL